MYEYSTDYQHECWAHYIDQNVALLCPDNTVYTYPITSVPCRVVAICTKVMGQDLQTPLMVLQALVLIASIGCRYFYA